MLYVYFLFLTLPTWFAIWIDLSWFWEATMIEWAVRVRIMQFNKEFSEIISVYLQNDPQCNAVLMRWAQTREVPGLNSPQARNDE